MKIPNYLKLTKKVLFNVAQPATFENPHLNNCLIDKMYKFMVSQNAIGLAAPQIGISKRIFVMSANNCPTFCFNPEIIKFNDTLLTSIEGCLSFPGEELTITRPISIDARYQNYKGEYIYTSLYGTPSICFQHELDHLNGIVFHNMITN
jgi:peptide deformylase